MAELQTLSDQLLAGTLAIDAAHPMQPKFVVETVADRTHFVSSFANVTAFETDAGLVLVDTGSFVLAEPTHRLVRSIASAPLHTAIWTHGHVDHCFGVELYEREPGAPRPRVIAHEAVSRRFARYRLTHGWNVAINARQFQTAAKFPSEFREPDETIATSRVVE